MNTQGVVGYGELELVSPYAVQTLQDICLVETVNDHARLTITGMISAEQKDQCMQEATSTDRIELYQTSKGKRIRPLFKGQVTDLTVQMVRGVYQIAIKAISSTATLDYKQKERSFQHEQLTYSEMIKQVLVDYQGADCIDSASKGAKIPHFILQYRETDWHFLQRMASHFRTVLVAAVDAEQPKLWFGLPEGRIQSLNVSHYHITKNRAHYLQYKHNDTEQPLTEGDLLTYQVTSTQHVALGDRVHFQGKELVVAKSTAQMVQGIWTYDYQLLPEVGIRQAKQTLSAHTGIALEGKVLEVKKDQVRLHLLIDKNQKKEEAAWFSLATPYSAEGHSGFYSPPEEGDSVQLVLPTAQEPTAFVRQTIRKGGDTNPKTADPKTAYWGNAKGKELKLDSQAVTVTAKEGAVFLKADQASGITVHSQHPLTVTAGGDLTMTGKRISFQAQETLRFTCSSSSFVLDGITDIQGQIVSLEGSIKAPVSVVSAEDDEEPDMEAALDVMGAIPQGGGA
ncbi:contractile injection system protein, VgrG/Pvc8 family [Bacillus ndiopicus]|uniref:contractile injection system protein, VgrG/Pvc8 family n=1 Tax=Bacillus ndiopicus TaxID=1347368 RepID=UPI0005A8A92F|nr:contractile injection system protein, VgrG/Pvc8 family [Bacillus ndiopicus]